MEDKELRDRLTEADREIGRLAKSIRHIAEDGLGQAEILRYAKAALDGHEARSGWRPSLHPEP